MDKKAFYNTLAKSLEGVKPAVVVESGQGSYLKINGKKTLNLCSNNYLGLASDDKLKKAAKKKIDEYGVGTGSVRTLSGTNSLHIELEDRLAAFKKAQACIVLQSGYNANLAAIQTILGKEDVVISDELNHASIIDAIKLAQIKNKFIYKHKDVSDLKKRIKEALAISKQTENCRILIVTDGVFSMDGDLCPLPGIVEAAKSCGAIVMVDDAHGEGVLGKNGRGIVDHFSLYGQVDIEVGTLSKAFGVIGGFITGEKVLIDYYKKNARQFLFSNGLSIPDTAALIASVSILEESDARVKTLWNNASFLKKELTGLGFDCGESQTPITPVMLGEEDLAIAFSSELLKEGIFATSIKFPMVAKGRARIRLMPSAIHSKDDLKFAISVFQKVGKKLKVIK